MLYEVRVSRGVGTVYRGTCARKARHTYAAYVAVSQLPDRRASGARIELVAGGAVVETYASSDDDDGGGQRR